MTVVITFLYYTNPLLEINIATQNIISVSLGVGVGVGLFEICQWVCTALLMGRIGSMTFLHCSVFKIRNSD